MIFTSPLPDVTIPDTALTPLMLCNAERLSSKAAIIDGPSGRTLTYGQLAGAIRLVAASLVRRGMKKGDVFAIYSPNLPEYAVAFHAVSLMGGINTTINPLYTVEELVNQLRDSSARYLLTIPQFLEKAMDAAHQAGVEEVFVLGEGEGATPFASLLSGDGQMEAPDINSTEDLVALPYSSGTTGLPKGVMLTHHNLIANVVQSHEVCLMTEEDTVIAILPFYHIYGMEVLLNNGLYEGATVVTLPRFDLEQFLTVMQDYKITRAFLVPPIILALAKHPLVDKYDLSNIKTITSGAAPLGEALARACAERLGCTVVQGYGMTETSPVTHIMPATRAGNKFGSIGPLLPNTEAKIVSIESGEEVGPNENGELCIRGPQVMKGYLNNPDATAGMIEPDGWLHTGDIGYADEDGDFYIVDRLKELIKYKGLQVAPAELEAVLLSHPAIADAAVIPSPDDEAGEVPKAFVVLRSPATEEEILSYVAERVSRQKKVRRLEFCDQIPKSSSGKILRRVLVEQERAKLRNG